MADRGAPHKQSPYGQPGAWHRKPAACLCSRFCCGPCGRLRFAETRKAFYHARRNVHQPAGFFHAETACVGRPMIFRKGESQNEDAKDDRRLVHGSILPVVRSGGIRTCARRRVLSNARGPSGSGCGRIHFLGNVERYSGRQAASRRLSRGRLPVLWVFCTGRPEGFVVPNGGHGLLQQDSSVEKDDKDPYYQWGSGCIRPSGMQGAGQ
jgi:hypothetical protein